MHLIEPIGPTTLHDCLRRLRSAHEFMVRRAVRAVPHEASDCWGFHTKRLEVDLSKDADESPPSDIGKRGEKLAEVINTAATVEHLCNAIVWAFRDVALRHYGVRACHPTTSDDGENDLILVCPWTGRLARFEASDQVWEPGGNVTKIRAKERDDCAKLRQEVGTRLFRIVSADLYPWMCRRLTNDCSGYRYAAEICRGVTCVAELR